MTDRWHVPRHLLAYLFIRLTALVLLIILISTGQLTELVVLFLPLIAMGLVWALAYRQARRRVHKWWRYDRRDD
jgi:Flp pilus assembly protein TadB